MMLFRRLILSCLVIMSFIVVIMIISKAAIIGITYDEAYSLYYYAGFSSGYYDPSTHGFLRFDIANNHPLNSALMGLSTYIFGDSEFAIRLPNVIMGIIYVMCIFLIVQKQIFNQSCLLIIALFLGNSYLIEYFSLARGYGIATACVQIGLTFLLLATDLRRGYTLLLLLLLISSLSIFSTFPLIDSAVMTLVGLGLIVKRKTEIFDGMNDKMGLMLRSDPTKILIGSLICCLLSLIPIYLLMKVSAPGLPLANNDGNIFQAMFVPIIGMYFWPSPINIGIISIVIFLVIIINIYHRSFSFISLFLVGMMIITILILGASANVLSKPYPPTRALLPYLPVFLLAVVSMFNDAARLYPKAGAIVSILIGIAIVGHFFATLNLHKSYDWSDNEGVREMIIHDGSRCVSHKALLGGDVMTPEAFYYRIRFYGLWTPYTVGSCE